MKIIFLLITIVSFSMFPQELKKIAGDLNFPEGPAWDGKGNLYVSSCYGGYIMKISKNGNEKFIDSSSSIMKQTNGLTFGKDGNLYGCDFGLGAIIRISPDKKVEIVSSGFEGREYDRPNDLAFHPNGLLYFSEPNSDQPDGRLFRMDVNTGKPEMLDDSLRYPNGMAFNEKADILYLSESASNRVLKYKLDKDGNILSKEVFIDLPGGEPDGIAIDTEGNIYVAHFDGGAVYVISPEGEVKEKIITPGKHSSNVEFGGDNLKTLYITEDETNSVYSLERETAGLKLLR
jgi:gluconolactonase